MSQEPTQKRTPNTPVQALTFLLIISLFLLLASSLSAYFNSLETENRYKELAKVMGRSIFREMVVVRRWNAEHGGVYVPVTERFQPNPYLEDARRDVTTADGITLTKINPEYMTRLLSEHLEKEDGIKIHITSLKLTSPKNKADSWEEEALHQFEQGSKEEAGILGPRDSALFRYMAPLETEEACLDCHGKQGHKVKDVRGGLSISFSYVPFLKAAEAASRQTYFVHTLFFLIGMTIVSLLGKGLISKLKELQKAFHFIKRLEGLLPICAHCKKIRTEGADPRDQESWIPIELYIEGRTDAQFTHGICPACVKRHYGLHFNE